MLAVALAVWLIVTFAPQVLLLLEGIVGILAGMVGGILLFLGIDAIMAKKGEKKKKAVKASQ